MRDRKNGCDRAKARLAPAPFRKCRSARTSVIDSQNPWYLKVLIKSHLVMPSTSPRRFCGPRYDLFWCGPYKTRCKMQASSVTFSWQHSQVHSHTQPRVETDRERTRENAREKKRRGAKTERAQESECGKKKRGRDPECAQERVRRESARERMRGKKKEEEQRPSERRRERRRASVE
jgi:hypothetical protein